MKPRTLLLLLAATASFLPGCVSEPAPDDTTVFGHAEAPKKSKKKPQPVVNTLVEEQ